TRTVLTAHEREDQEGGASEDRPDRRPDDQREGDSAQEVRALVRVLCVPGLGQARVRCVGAAEGARGELLPDPAVTTRAAREPVSGDEPPPTRDAAEETPGDRSRVPELDVLVGGLEGGAGRRRSLEIDLERAHRGTLTELVFRAFACGVLATTTTASRLPRAARRSRSPTVALPRAPVRGKATVGLRLRRAALGKRLAVVVVARTPHAKARKTSSVRVPR